MKLNVWWSGTTKNHAYSICLNSCIHTYIHTRIYAYISICICYTITELICAIKRIGLDMFMCVYIF